MDKVGKQKAGGLLDTRVLVINSTGTKEAHLKCLHINKDVPTGQHCVETSLTFPGKSAWLGASLKCLYTNARSKTNKQGELKICLQVVAGIQLTGILETR